MRTTVWEERVFTDLRHFFLYKLQQEYKRNLNIKSFKFLDHTPFIHTYTHKFHLECYLIRKKSFSLKVKYNYSFTSNISCTNCIKLLMNMINNGHLNISKTGMESWVPHFRQSKLQITESTYKVRHLLPVFWCFL